MIENFIGGRALGVGLNSLQRGVAQRHARRLLATPSSALPTWRLSSSCGTSSSASLGHFGTPAESGQNTLGDFQLIELIRELCAFGVDPCKPFGDPLLLLANLV
jgi:hypothetical protein